MGGGASEIFQNDEKPSCVSIAWVSRSQNTNLSSKSHNSKIYVINKKGVGKGRRGHVYTFKAKYHRTTREQLEKKFYSQTSFLVNVKPTTISNLSKGKGAGRENE